MQCVRRAATSTALQENRSGVERSQQHHFGAVILDTPVSVFAPTPSSRKWDSCYNSWETGFTELDGYIGASRRSMALAHSKYMFHLDQTTLRRSSQKRDLISAKACGRSRLAGWLPRTSTVVLTALFSQDDNIASMYVARHVPGTAYHRFCLDPSTCLQPILSLPPLLQCSLRTVQDDHYRTS